MMPISLSGSGQGGAAAPSSSGLSFYDDASIVFGSADKGAVSQSTSPVSTSTNPYASNAAYIPQSSLGYATPTSSGSSLLWIGLIAAAALGAWFMFKR
jgi:hypothetical protein